jgi:hypothetical protein
MMKKLFVLSALFLFIACNEAPKGNVTTPASQANVAGMTAPIQPAVDPVKRGAYLVSIMGCHDCHTPFKMGPKGPEPDMTLALSGHPEAMGALKPAPADKGPWVWSGAGTNTAYSGPWGVSYAMNLTPDENTGLGIWTEEMFVGAIRTGRHMGTSRPIQPPMPWPVYRNATDEDLKAIYAYLRTIKPIKNRIPDYQPPA